MACTAQKDNNYYMRAVRDDCGRNRGLWMTHTVEGVMTMFIIISKGSIQTIAFNNMIR